MNNQSTAEIYKSFFTIGKRLIAESEVGSVLTIAIDSAIELAGAERGLIILFAEDGNILFETARYLKKEDLENPKFEVSRTIIRKVRTEKKPLCLRNALDDPTLKKSNSVALLKILSVICLPLTFEQQVFGVVYLDNRTVRGAFEEKTCEFMCEFADFISLAAYRALEHKRLHNHVNALETEIRGKYQFASIIGHHPKMIEILKLVSQIADTTATVLIQGESGTGKELIARALHYNSRRREKPFVAINCAALPENLLESELFGHVRGAFTGAIKDKAGWFECADGSTIFLDEVNEMCPALQTKLLRILQTGEYSRLGSTEIRHCDVRVVAASSRDLKALVKEGKFREEVYYRLNVIDLWLPPLRERRCDIPTLAQYFLKFYGDKYGKKELSLTTKGEARLLAYDFPGNVRELENIIQRAVILTDGVIIDLYHLPAILNSSKDNRNTVSKSSIFKTAKEQVVAQFEYDYLIECLKTAHGNISRASRIAGLDIKNLHDKIKKYGIDPRILKNNPI